MGKFEAQICPAELQLLCASASPREQNFLCFTTHTIALASLPIGVIVTRAIHFLKCNGGLLLESAWKGFYKNTILNIFQLFAAHNNHLLIAAKRVAFTRVAKLPEQLG